MSIDSTAYSDTSYFNVSVQAPMVIGVAGGADAGKRDFCNVLKDQISKVYTPNVHIMNLSDFYRELTPEERQWYESGRMNLDHPNAFDFELLEKTLKSILAGQPTPIPVWDRAHHRRQKTVVLEPIDVLLLEGTLVLYPKELRDLMFMKVFIDIDSDQRLARRVQKSKSRSGQPMTMKQVLTEYVEFVKPMFVEFIAASKRFADIIIPRGVDNTAALQVLANHLEDHLRCRSLANSKGKDTTTLPDRPGINARPSHIPPSYRPNLFSTAAASSFKTIPE